MGKYDNIMRFAEIRKFMQEKQYKKALNTVEQIDANKIKVVTELNLMADVFVKNEKYKEAKELLFRIYENSPTRRVIYQLICLCLKTADIQVAEGLYEEYKELDKDSSDKLILEYCIAKAKGTNKVELISYLEKLKKEDYQEEWAYELAKLYHKQGMEEACVRECSDIILWFGEGLIVEKAKLLKLHYVEGLDIIAPQSPKISKAIKAREDNQEERMAKPVPSDTQELTKDKQSTLEQLNEDEWNTETEQSETKQSEAEQPEMEEIATEEIETESDIMEKEHIDKESEIDKVKEESEVSIEEEFKETMVDKIVRETFERVETTPGPLHFIIVEERQLYLTEIVKGIAKELCAREILPTSQVAKITAEKLNQISLKEKGERLKNGCLLIEQAGDLTGESINGIISFIKENEDSIVVMLEDNEDAIHWLLKKNKKLKQWFSFHIYLPME